MKDKIDIVYLWVDSTDKSWRAEKDKWYEIINGQKPIYKGAAGEERFRDNGELMFSFRSVAECVPWINHIYIITGFNQVPKWLDTNHPKITIVPHEQIIPADALPTFNATAIEMCIPNIPGLSEHFILMNDDMFFNKKVSPSFFYDAHGRAIFNYSKSAYDASLSFEKWKATLDGYTQTLALSAKYIDEMFTSYGYSLDADEITNNLANKNNSYFTDLAKKMSEVYFINYAKELLAAAKITKDVTEADNNDTNADDDKIGYFSKSDFTSKFKAKYSD